MKHNRQTGIALITVLLVLSLATVAAVSMTTRQQLDIRRTSNVLRTEEAYMALLAAEEFTRALLLFDLTQTITPNDRDGRGDYWNDPRLQSAVQTIGNFTITNLNIEDLQGRFNINNLLTDPNAHSENNYQNFRSLLGEYGLREDLADKAIDWMDANHDPRPGGAEDSDYQSLSKPYLPAGREMVSASEINRLMGVNLSGKDDYDGSNKKLRKTISDMLLGEEQKVLIALPRGTAININTAVSPAIFQMIVPGMTADDAQTLFTNTMVAPETAPYFKDANAFWGDSLVSKYKVSQNRQVKLSVDSNYFLLHAEAINDDLVVYSNTVFYRTRNPNSVRVIHRSYGRAGEI